MKLFLASEAKNPITLRHLDKISGGLSGKTIVYIPTAANGERGWQSWKEGGTWEIVQKLGANITLVQLEDYKDKSILKNIKGKDIIWFAGGVPGYLMYWINRTALDLYLPKILKSGTLFVGSSAGAMVAGKTLDVASWGFVDGERGAENIKPLGLVNFDIYPHYQDRLYKKIKQNYKGKKLYLLKNEESILVDNNKIKLFGSERTIKYGKT